MIAMKREVAAGCESCTRRQVFRGANVKLGNWRQVTDFFYGKSSNENHIEGV